MTLKLTIHGYMDEFDLYAIIDINRITQGFAIYLFYTFLSPFPLKILKVHTSLNC